MRVIHSFILIFSVKFYLFFPPILPLLFCRVGDSYDERRFIDERYQRDAIYQRNTFPRDGLDREAYLPPGPAVGHWSQSKRRGYDEDYPLERQSRRLQRPYHESYNQIDRDREIGMYQEYDKFQDDYTSIENYADRGYDKPARFAGDDRDDYAYDDYGYKSRVSHHRREDSHERDYDHGRHSYDSDYDRGNRRDSNWRQRESRERDTKGLSRERDLSPHRKHERSHSHSRSRSRSRSRRSRSRSHSHSHSRSRSQSRGYDDHPRSRSPRGRSHSRSYREDSYVDSRYDRSERRRDREDKRQREHYSVVCDVLNGAFILSVIIFTIAGEFDLNGIFAGPICNCCCERSFTEDN